MVLFFLQRVEEAYFMRIADLKAENRRSVPSAHTECTSLRAEDEWKRHGASARTSTATDGHRLSRNASMSPSFVSAISPGGSNCPSESPSAVLHSVSALNHSKKRG